MGEVEVQKVYRESYKCRRFIDLRPSSAFGNENLSGRSKSATEFCSRVWLCLGSIGRRVVKFSEVMKPICDPGWEWFNKQCEIELDDRKFDISKEVGRHSFTPKPKQLQSGNWNGKMFAAGGNDALLSIHQIESHCIYYNPFVTQLLRKQGKAKSTTAFKILVMYFSNKYV